MPESITTYAQVESSRVSILDAPVMNPGTCAICGTSRNDDRKYIDLGLDVDFIGVIYFCTFCIQELVNRIGCAMPDQVKVLEDELTSARQTILEFQSQKAAYDDAINTLRSTGLFSGTDLSPITHPTITPEPEPVANVIRTEQKSASASRQAKQSNIKQGSNDLPKPGSDDFDFNI